MPNTVSNVEKCARTHARTHALRAVGLITSRDCVIRFDSVMGPAHCTALHCTAVEQSRNTHACLLHTCTHLMHAHMHMHIHTHTRTGGFAHQQCRNALRSRSTFRAVACRYRAADGNQHAVSLLDNQSVPPDNAEKRSRQVLKAPHRMQACLPARVLYAPHCRLASPHSS